MMLDPLFARCGRAGRERREMRGTGVSWRGGGKNRALGACMWSYENHGECEGHRLIDNGMGYDPPTREQYVAMMRDHRASGVRPVWRFFRFHPEDRDLYAPLIAAAEDDAREHGGVEIEVEEDVREKRVCR